MIREVFMNIFDKNKNIIQIANVLLTRRCNLRCNYCNIVRNYLGKPSEYPDMQYYIDNEQPYQKWIEAFDRIHTNNPDVFFILYGGEPLLYNDLDKLISYLKDYGYNHTIISNNTPVIRKKIAELIDKVGPLPGFTASVDPELCMYLDQLALRDDDAIRKTISGFEHLCYLKDNGLADDVVAEITVSKDNIQYLYKTVQILTNHGIYSSITTIDAQKSPYYDFSAVTTARDAVLKDINTRLIFDKIINDKTLLVHMPQMLNDLYDILPCEMKCNIPSNVHNVCIDPDTSFRLCLRIRGTESPKITVADGIDKDSGKLSDELINALQYDYDHYCKGCNHTCLLMSSRYANNIVNH